LRGDTPDPYLVGGLVAITVVYGAIAILGLRRRLRTSEG
jgi:hypothetical protein